MRLGGKVFEKTENPQQWVQAHKDAGYRAAYCPLEADADDATVEAYVNAAREADLVIAEVGAWSNPIDPNEEGRRNNIAKCQRQLALADRVGARCCVNISGSRGPKWNGPSPENITSETFDLIVESLREIIDEVKPTRSYYTLEMLGWSLPDSAESYLELINAVDRKAFAVHVDPVNLVNSPRRYYENGKLMEHAFRTLAPYIRSVHAKDITMGNNHLVHIDECRPGTGELDFGVFLREMDKLEPDTPLMLEHLPNAEEYKLAADHIRQVAQKEGVTL
ncbi:MAG: sugar phosphate isomerase/epimerase family protein [Phycisphaerae bacterium]